LKNRKPVVAGNWKMNGNHDKVEALLRGILSQLAENKTLSSAVDMLVLPPAIYVPQVVELLRQSHIEVGVQDVSEHESGAYTGEIAAAMAVDVGVKYTLIGHSERRNYWTESSELVARKFASAQAAGLVPVLCLGETQKQREQGQTEEVVIGQLETVLDQVRSLSFERALIAYEPVWAIGTGFQATPEQAQEVHATIRSRLASESMELAEMVKILYGGSVQASSAYELFLQPDIDGALVGGASLEADSFVKIAVSAAEASR